MLGEEDIISLNVIYLCVLKELERSIELSNSSYQRQLAAERKKTISAQDEIRTLQDELERMANKLKVHMDKHSLNCLRSFDENSIL